MKVNKMKVTKGKARRYVATHWVMENAIEAYKAWLNGLYTGAPLNYDLYEMNTEATEKGTGTILAFTLEGFKVVRVA